MDQRAQGEEAKASGKAEDPEGLKELKRRERQRAEKQSKTNSILYYILYYNHFILYSILYLIYMILFFYNECVLYHRFMRIE